MTLQQLFDQLATHPLWWTILFIAIPMIALILGFIVGKNDSGYAPWRYIYSALIYIACIPGVFAITLTIYFFMFERRSILDTDVLVQVLPFFSMIITLMILRRFTDLERIPGFDRISGLLLMIATAFFILWIIDKTRIFAFTYIPFFYIILLFLGLLIVLRFGWRKLFRNSTGAPGS